MKQILMIGTGGTIASEMTEAGLVPGMSGAEFLQYIPSVEKLCQVDCLQVCNIDSTNMTPSHWLAIAQAVEEAEGGIQSMLDDAAMAVMTLNGGSAVPLWNTWLDGLQEEAPEGEEIDVAGLKAIFAKALEELEDMSGAKVGDKTMMDALIPASEAVAAYTGDSADELFDAAAQAAAQGAEATKQYVSKFGRAKSYGTKTIGTPDAGAVSMSWFFQGLARE